MALPVLLLLFGWSNDARAHDIPGELRVHMHARPEGERLHVAIRVPLSLLLNLNLPKHGPGYLDLPQVEMELPRVLAALDKDVEWSENGKRLLPITARGRITVPADRSFESFERARDLVLGPPLPAATYVFWNQGYFDAYLQYPISSARASVELDFHLAPGLRDRLKIDLRYTTNEGAVRAHEFATGTGVVPLDPHWHQAAWSFVKAGFAHILAGPDHLLFLVCLVLPLRKLNVYLLGVVTSFTVAHSITLIAAAYGLTPGGAWFRPLVETLIAGSVLYMAVENIVRHDVTRRWLWSGLFGLVHGFGFSFLLSSQLQFAGSHLLLSLLAFNIGIEAGQLLVLLVMLPVISLILASGWVAERTFILLVSVLVAHTAGHWSMDRAQELAAADWTTDELLPLFLAAALLGATLAALRALPMLQRRRAAGLQDK